MASFTLGSMKINVDKVTRILLIFLLVFAALVSLVCDPWTTIGLAIIVLSFVALRYWICDERGNGSSHDLSITAFIVLFIVGVGFIVRGNLLSVLGLVYGSGLAG